MSPIYNAGIFCSLLSLRQSVQCSVKLIYGPPRDSRLISQPFTRSSWFQKTTKQKKPRVNTAVYVTSLPSDATVDEISGIFSRCGMIAEELETKKPRIKMYEDENGIFKGEALIVYFRPESVDLAIQLLDETKLRLGDRQTGKMKVQPADFSFKAHQEDAPANRMNQADKKKLLKKKEKMNNKLADWDDDDPSVAQKGSSRWDKVVVLKHMFSLQEIEVMPLL